MKAEDDRDRAVATAEQHASLYQHVKHELSISQGHLEAAKQNNSELQVRSFSCLFDVVNIHT